MNNPISEFAEKLRVAFSPIDQGEESKRLVYHSDVVRYRRVMRRHNAAVDRKQARRVRKMRRQRAWDQGVLRSQIKVIESGDNPAMYRNVVRALQRRMEAANHG